MWRRMRSWSRHRRPDTYVASKTKLAGGSSINIATKHSRATRHRKHYSLVLGRLCSAMAKACGWQKLAFHLEVKYSCSVNGRSWWTSTFRGCHYFSQIMLQTSHRNRRRVVLLWWSQLKCRNIRLITNSRCPSCCSMCPKRKRHLPKIS